MCIQLIKSICLDSLSVFASQNKKQKILFCWRFYSIGKAALLLLFCLIFISVHNVHFLTFENSFSSLFYIFLLSSIVCECVTNQTHAFQNHNLEQKTFFFNCEKKRIESRLLPVMQMSLNIKAKRGSSIREKRTNQPFSVSNYRFLLFNNTKQNKTKGTHLATLIYLTKNYILSIKPDWRLHPQKYFLFSSSKKLFFSTSNLCTKEMRIGCAFVEEMKMTTQNRKK